jgi:hypothetical protein
MEESSDNKELLIEPEAPLTKSDASIEDRA